MSSNFLAWCCRTNCVWNGEELTQYTTPKIGKFPGGNLDRFPSKGIDGTACLHELYQIAGTILQYHKQVQLDVL